MQHVFHRIATFFDEGRWQRAVVDFNIIDHCCASKSQRDKGVVNLFSKSATLMRNADLHRSSNHIMLDRRAGEVDQRASALVISHDPSRDAAVHVERKIRGECFYAAKDGVCRVVTLLEGIAVICRARWNAVRRLSDRWCLKFIKLCANSAVRLRNFGSPACQT